MTRRPITLRLRPANLVVVLILSAILGVPLIQRAQAESPPATTVAMSRLPMATPESASMRSQRLADVEPLIMQGISAGQFPGAVICVGRHGKVVYLRAFGERQVVDDHVPMTTDTVFDMASITKPVVTATCIMKLVETNHLRLTDKLAEYYQRRISLGIVQLI